MLQIEPGALISLLDGSQLQVLEVVRTIVHKRVVCRANWQNQAVFAKIFIGKDAEKYAKRDAAGIAVLQAEQIATPKLLHKTSAVLANGDAAHIIILEEIKDAKTADELWPTLEPEAQFALATKLVETVALHHACEIVHTDLHLKNFLVTNEFIYTLDGDGVRQYADLTYKPALKNLAVLISKFDVLEQAAWLPALLESYKKFCVWHLPMEVKQVAPLANKHRLKIASGYANKKVFRNCTDVQVHALSGLFYAASSAYKINIPKNLAELEALIQPQNMLKNGNTCTVALAEIDAQKTVIKRYNIKNIWHGISRALRKTRAAVSWENAHRLKLLGIATAAPIALIESRKFGFLRGKAYFLAEYIDAPDAAEYFAQTQNKTERAEAVKNIVTLFYRLFLLQISHGDMKASNIKMQGTQPVLIDLDSMRQHSQAGQALQAHVRDLRRFMENWQNEPALYNAFVKTFKVIYPDAGMLIKAGIGANKEMIE